MLRAGSACFGIPWFGIQPAERYQVHRTAAPLPSMPLMPGNPRRPSGALTTRRSSCLSATMLPWEFWSVHQPVLHSMTKIKIVKPALLRRPLGHKSENAHSWTSQRCCRMVALLCHSKLKASPAARVELQSHQRPSGPWGRGRKKRICTNSKSNTSNSCIGNLIKFSSHQRIWGQSLKSKQVVIQILIALQIDLAPQHAKNGQKQRSWKIRKMHSKGLLGNSESQNLLVTSKRWNCLWKRPICPPGTANHSLQHRKHQISETSNWIGSLWLKM